MWIRTKDEAIALIQKAKESIPDLRDPKIEHDRFYQNLGVYLSDLNSAIGSLPPTLQVRLDQILEANYSHDGISPFGLEGSLKRKYWRYRGFEDFFTLLEEWVVLGFERGMYPVKREASTPKDQPSTVEQKGWSFIGNGVSAVLRVNGTGINYESSARGKGKAYPLLLLQLLSWPGTKIVSEADFADAVRKRWGIDDTDDEAYQPRAFRDAIRSMNADVKKALGITEEFIVETGSGFGVNQYFL